MTFDFGCRAWILGIGMDSIGAEPNVPFVTRNREALKASSDGVYMLGLWRTAFCVKTTELGVGSRNSRSVNSMLESLTPSWAILGMAT